MKNKFSSYIFSFSLILFLFLTGIRFCCFNRSFYDYQHEKLTLYGQSLPQYIGTDESGLSELTDFLLSYLENKTDSLDLKMELHGYVREVFNQKEKTHMVDVKNLYLLFMDIRTVCLAVSIVSFAYSIIKHKKTAFIDLFASYRKMLLLYSIVIAAISFAVAIDFDSFWTTFHHIFFAGNDLWLLSLKTDVLIMIVPPEFFNNLLYFIIITIIVLLAIAYSLLFILSRKAAIND